MNICLIRSHLDHVRIPLNPNRYLGSLAVLAPAKQYMDDNGLKRPILVAQAHHVTRSALMAKKVGIDPIIPEGLPNVFDKYSDQWWTTSNISWNVRELPGIFALKALDKI